MLPMAVVVIIMMVGGAAAAATAQRTVLLHYVHQAGNEFQFHTDSTQT